MSTCVRVLRNIGGGRGGNAGVHPGVSCCGIATTAALYREQAGKYKVTKYQTFPLTYEMACKPKYIGIKKAWLTWHTQDLYQFRQRLGRTTFEDEFIRRFMHGTWFGLFASELVIKRRGNLLIINGFVNRRGPGLYKTKMYWLIGYTEEMLSGILKQPVKVELQTVADKKDMVYKYI